MSSAVVETNYGQQEGGDTLKTFLLEHKNILKKGVDSIYNVLQENDIEEYQELIQFSETDLRQILETIKPVHIGKLINILRNIPESTIYTAYNKEKVVIVLSDEEHNALNNIKEKSGRIKQYKQQITDTISKLNENKIQSKQEIDKQTKLMMEAVQKRQKELTIKLDNIINDKTAKLTKQLLNLQDDETKVNECYTKCQAMVDDTTLDSIKRKNKILTNTKSLLSNKNIASYDDFKIVESADIITKIDIKNVINTVNVCGDIMGDSKPFPPIITIKQVKAKSVALNIKTDEDDIIGYRLKYGIFDDDNKEDIDEMKTDWKNIQVNESNNSINYNVEILTPLTNYVLYGFCKNINGFGQQSKPIIFKTKKQVQIVCDEWDKENSYSNIDIIGSRVCSKDDIQQTVYGKKVIKSGIFTWKMRMHKEDPEICTNYPFVGIIKNDSNLLQKHKTYTGWYDNDGGYLFCGGSNLIGPPSTGKKYGTDKFMNTGDTLELTLDLDKRTITYCVNGKDQGTAFTNIQNDSYRLAVGLYEAKECQIELL